jgi:uncharacterized protein YegP (UPF0339 family)
VADKKLQIERIFNGQFLWRFKSSNGRQVSWSGETYVNLSDCMRGAILGSPVTAIFEEGTIQYFDTDELAIKTGQYEFINSWKDDQGKPITRSQVPAMALAEHLAQRPDVVFALESGFRIDSSGHPVMNNRLYHTRSEDLEDCVFGCGLKLVEEVENA